MGRSVMTHHRATSVAYFYLETVDEDGNELWIEWDDECEQYAEWLRSLWPSFVPASGWEGNELRRILVSNLAEVYISEYCGVVALSLVPLDKEWPECNLAGAWCGQIADKFNRLGTLGKVGTFSNGGSIYTKR